ncbi:hypothetical protein [Undibacterium squillarum]|uniref:hypothetical protein n=1 Tax=Undibacterium squillarum TaxID=1131567 RepID=UPI0035B3A546
MHSFTRKDLLRPVGYAAFGSAFVLKIAEVSSLVWMTQGVAVLICVLAALTAARQRAALSRFALPVAVAATALLAAPLLMHAQTPARWLMAGPVRLYLAPVLLPLILLTVQHGLAFQCPKEKQFALTLGGALIILSLQPDLAQVLAFAVAAIWISWQHGLSKVRLAALVMMSVLTAGIAAAKPDLLSPVPHVEEVFALGFRHSVLSGLGITGAAIAMLIAIWRVPGQHLRGVALYYFSLMLISLTGITPVPMLGYGAGPWLGLALALALGACFPSGPVPLVQADQPDAPVEH